MPAQKDAKKRKSVTIIAGWIMGIGAIIAAIIGILPDLANGAPSKDNILGTPFNYNKYDDPVGEFSVEYPSNFHIGSRGYGNFNKFSLSFFPDNDDGPISLMFVEISKIKDTDFDAQEYVNNYAIDVINGNNFNKEGFQAFLVSNEQTSKGYYLHYKTVCTNCDNDPSHMFMLWETENNIIAGVIVFARDGEISSHAQNVIDYVVKSFHWSSDDVENLFK